MLGTVSCLLTVLANNNQIAGYYVRFRLTIHLLNSKHYFRVIVRIHSQTQTHIKRTLKVVLLRVRTVKIVNLVVDEVLCRVANGGCQTVL